MEAKKPFVDAKIQTDMLTLDDTKLEYALEDWLLPLPLAEEIGSRRQETKLLLLRRSALPGLDEEQGRDLLWRYLQTLPGLSPGFTALVLIGESLHLLEDEEHLTYWAQLKKRDMGIWTCRASKHALKLEISAELETSLTWLDTSVLLERLSQAVVLTLC